ncbi:MAG TPA: DinB family protein [Gemmatimonadales bacterium]|nr:DinB family protein [Gemmatimonadales bacterium]
MTPHLDHLLRYNAWANQETLSSLRDGAPAPRGLKWMAHIIGAEYLWMARLEGETARLPVWPDLDLQACGDHLADLARRWPRYLEQGRNSHPEEVTYINSVGETWTNTADQILTHVVIHSAYHRGQIASDLRAAGSVPAYTDYIHAVRQRHIE